MAFNVTDFRKNMKYDGARPALFDVTLYPYQIGSWGTEVNSALKFKAKAASLPASNIGTKTISYFGRDVHFAGNRTFDDWIITVYNDEDFNIRNAFEKWMNAIDRHTQVGRADPFTDLNPDGYTSTGLVSQYGKDGSVIKRYTFASMWPSSLSAITVDWDSKDDIESFDVTFKYDYYQASDENGTGFITT